MERGDLYSTNDDKSHALQNNEYQSHLSNKINEYEINHDKIHHYRNDNRNDNRNDDEDDDSDNDNDSDDDDDNDNSTATATDGGVGVGVGSGRGVGNNHKKLTIKIEKKKISDNRCRKIGPDIGTGYGKSHVNDETKSNNGNKSNDGNGGKYPQKIIHNNHTTNIGDYMSSNNTLEDHGARSIANYKKMEDGFHLDDDGSLSFLSTSTRRDYVYSGFPDETYQNNKKNASMSEENIPDDRFYLAYFIFVILSIGSLVPGTVFLYAIDFYTFVYPTYSVVTPYLLSFGFNTGQIVGITLMILISFRHKSISSGITLHYRFYLFFTINFLTIAITVFVHGFAIFDISEIHHQHVIYHVTYWTIMITNSMSGIAAGIIVASTFSLAAIFPCDYTQGASTGLAFAAVIVSFFRLITRFVFADYGDLADGYSTSTITFFTGAALFQFVCMASFYVLIRLPITRYCIQRQENLELYEEPEEDDGDNHLPRAPSYSVNQESNSLISNQEESAKQHAITMAFGSWISVVKKLGVVGSGLIFNFLATYSLMPGIISDILPTKSDDIFHGDDGRALFIILLFTTFSLGDALGRLSPSWKRTVKLDEKQLWIVIAFRFSFFVIIPCMSMFSNDVHNVWKFVTVAAMALSHGYCTSMAMMLGPSLVHLKEQEKAGVVMALNSILGLFTGALIALMLGYIIKLL